MGGTLNPHNLPFGGKQAQVQDVVYNKAAGYQIDLILDGIFPAGIEVIRSIPLWDIGFNIGEDYQIGQWFDLSERSRDTDYGTSHIGHLFDFDKIMKEGRKTTVILVLYYHKAFPARINEGEIPTIVNNLSTVFHGQEVESVKN